MADDRDDRDDREDRVSLDGLDPDVALKALLAVDPDADPVKSPEAMKDDQDATRDGK